MRHEKHGGWGKHITGMENAVAKLKGTEETTSIGVDLEAYRLEVLKARSLQPGKIESRTDKELVDDLAYFQKKEGFEFPPEVCRATLTRARVEARNQIAASSDASIEDVQSFVAIASAWSMYGSTPGKFDVLKPRQCDLAFDAIEVHATTFENEVVRQFIIPELLKDDIESAAVIGNVIPEFMTQLEAVDTIYLNDAESDVLDSFLNIGHGLQADQSLVDMWHTATISNDSGNEC